MRTRIIAIFASAALYAALMGGISLYQFLKNSGAERRRDEVLASLRGRAPMLINAALKSPSAVTLEEYDFLENFSREPGLGELVYLAADETVRWHRQPGAIGRPSREIVHETSFATGVVARAFSTLSFAAARAPSGDLEVVVPFSVKRRPVTLLAFTLSAAEHRRAAAAGVVRYAFLALSAVLLLCAVLYFLLRRYVENPLSSLAFWMDGASLRGGDQARAAPPPPAAGEVSAAAARLAARARDELAAVEKRLASVVETEQAWWRALLGAAAPAGARVIVVDENNNVIYSNSGPGEVRGGEKVHLLDVVDSNQQDLLRLIGEAFESPGRAVEGRAAFRGRPVRVKVLHVGEGADLGRTLILFSAADAPAA